MFIVIILFLIVGFYTTYPFIVLFHEMGHALAHITLSTPKKVEIFIGSHGNRNTKIKFKAGKLQFYIKQSFWLTGGGACISDTQEVNYVNEIIILLAGSVLSFLVAIIIGVVAFNTEIHSSVKLYCFLLILYSLCSLYSSLKPRTLKHSGIDNDGKLISFTYKYRNVYAKYVNSLNLLNVGEFKQAYDMLYGIIAVYPNEAKFLRQVALCLLHLKDYQGALDHLELLEKVDNPTVTDNLHRGIAYSLTNRHDQAIPFYRSTLQLDKNNIVALNNLGYSLILICEYGEAESLLNKAIEINPDFSALYNSLGFLRIVNDDLEVGKALVEKSIQLDTSDAYAYKHLGIYYLKTLEKNYSLFNFEKALELDQTINIEPYFRQAQSLE